MGKPKLVVVENFNELTPGVRVVWRCQHVDGDHFPCLNEHEAMIFKVGRFGLVKLAAKVLPAPSCVPNEPGFAICPDDIPYRFVKRWIDLEGSEEARASRKVVRV